MSDDDKVISFKERYEALKAKKEAWKDEFETFIEEMGVPVVRTEQSGPLGWADDDVVCDAFETAKKLYFREDLRDAQPSLLLLGQFMHDHILTQRPWLLELLMPKAATPLTPGE